MRHLLTEEKMKHHKLRRQPPVVEVRRSRAVVAAPEARRAMPDGRIETSHDDAQQRQQDAEARKTKLEQNQAAITEWCERFRGANDPDVIRQVGAQQVASQAVDDMAYVQHIPDPRDPRMIVRPRDKGQYSELKKATEVLLPEASVTRGVVTDPKFPHKAPPWSFIKDTRKDSK
jgi:hypothetical protein